MNQYGETKQIWGPYRRDGWLRAMSQKGVCLYTRSNQIWKQRGLEILTYKTTEISKSSYKYKGVQNKRVDKDAITK